MVSCPSASLPSKQFPSLAVVPRASVGMCRCRTCYLAPFTFPRGSLSPCTTQKNSKATLNMVGLGQSSIRSHVGALEDLDCGSGSDNDDKQQEAEENELDFESDWEEEKGSSGATMDDKQTGIDYEDELAKETEQLLEPEERVILQQNAAPNFEKISTEKWSPLHTLSLSGQIHFLDQLLENDVPIDFPDKDGLTALHVSVVGKKEAAVSHLLRKGANPQIKDKDGITPLHYAVQVGAIQIVKLLIKYTVDVNVSDEEGWTPLHVAMQNRNRDIAKVLLINGADKTRKNKDGKTPLDLSLAYGKDFRSYDLAKLLKLVPANRDL